MAGSTAPGATASTDPSTLLRSRQYLSLLVTAAVLGVPLSAFAFGLLALSHELQTLLYTDLPTSLGFDGTPAWWPLPLLGVGALLVAWSIRYLPGHGGHEPTAGLAVSGPQPLAAMPGVFCAALGTLAFGAVLGPEAPLLAMGGGLAAGVVRRLKPGLPDQAYAVLGATGSFAAVSSLLGSPLLGAFLLMEASGLGGPLLAPVLLPGLLASGIGALIFIGMDSWTGLGTYSLTLPHVPQASTPTAAEFGWTLLIGVGAALVGAAIRWLAIGLRKRVAPRRATVTLLLGLSVAALAIAYAQGTGKPATQVLYSGQSAMGPLLTGAASYSAGALVLLAACKGLAYTASLSCFRGGPIFPAMFVGAAGGILMSHLPGLSLLAGFATGIGALGTAMLRLPLTSVLLATLLLGKQGLTEMPLVIVAVVVSYITTNALSPRPEPEANRTASGGTPQGPRTPPPPDAASD